MTFGPQLIGSTEKSLNALLHTILARQRLTEPQWVALRLAGQNPDAEPLADLIARRAHFPETAGLVSELRSGGLLDGETLSPAGAALTSELQAQIASLTGPIFADLPADDVRAAERILTTVDERARRILEGVTENSNPAPRR